MARKSYSDKEREQVKESLMITVLQSIVKQGLVHSSIDTLCKKVGISKTFFYSFFPSKEELVLQALRYQQPKLLRYAQELMDDPKLSWRESVKAFLKNCCYGGKAGFAILSIEEEQQVHRCLSKESFQEFRNEQARLYHDLLTIFGVPENKVDPRLFGNLSLTTMMIYKAIPDAMPFLFPEVADDMVEFQINALLDEMQRAKKNQ
ncbi:TetR/AcrR family transcriptional regulator [Faecalibacterium prausnitzii]|uniref:Transcriptional regulator, TetR family n=1 Tax=Faecalibacterium prausnitzii M21/2 TaxID=411485 RepID=A8SHQ5_9FIRM|nr:TetR/AcrR family transcriptional regulator [Faecalibacterium prausnitzii]EDP20641.1 transcriptional regulator, TetR family [Faecalibacterium prausnitzii M21/2]